MVRTSAALHAAENASTLLNRRMRDSGGNEEGEDDEGSEDGPSMRSMNGLNDNQPASALHAEIAIYLHSLMRNPSREGTGTLSGFPRK